jgi:hypothetical protein
VTVKVLVQMPGMKKSSTVMGMICGDET